MALKGRTGVKRQLPGAQPPWRKKAHLAHDGNTTKAFLQARAIPRVAEQTLGQAIGLRLEPTEDHAKAPNSCYGSCQKAAGCALAVPKFDRPDLQYTHWKFCVSRGIASLTL